MARFTFSFSLLLLFALSSCANVLSTPTPAATLTLCEVRFKKAAAISEFQDTVGDLDEALTFCNSIEQWEAASERFPDAVDGAHPPTYLAIRCATLNLRNRICNEARGDEELKVWFALNLHEGQ